jgi:hypothetical protein
MCPASAVSARRGALKPSDYRALRYVATHFVKNAGLPRPMIRASSVVRLTFVDVIAADGKPPAFVGGQLRASGIDCPKRSEPHVATLNAERVSDEQIRRAILVAEDAAIRKAVAKARQSAQRRLYLTLGR